MERFLEKVELIPFHECWEWTASTNALGYGRLQRGRRGEGILKAHRASYELFVGPTNGLCVLHKCDNPGCVNPKHLMLGTKKDNSRDMMKKGRGGGQFIKNDPRSKWYKKCAV